MSLRSVGRVFPGFALVSAGGGGGGGTTSEILASQTIVLGSGDIAHTLGVEPLTVEFFDSDGKPLILEWEAKAGSLTTIITTSASFALYNGATIKLSANA